MHILIVDDEAENRVSLSEVLRAEGYLVDTASDGREALELARNMEFDAIVSDALMPHMDGFVLCRSLKAEENLKDIPVIIMTGEYTEIADVQFAKSLGAMDVLRKTASPDQLLRILSTLSELPRPAHTASYQEIPRGIT